MVPWWPQEWCLLRCVTVIIYLCMHGSTHGNHEFVQKNQISTAYIHFKRLNFFDYFWPTIFWHFNTFQHIYSNELKCQDKLPIVCWNLLIWSWFSDWVISFFVHHDDVIKWKPFPRYWPFVRWLHRSPVNSPHKDAELWCFLWSALE